MKINFFDLKNSYLIDKNKDNLMCNKFVVARIETSGIHTKDAFLRNIQVED